MTAATAPEDPKLADALARMLAAKRASEVATDHLEVARAELGASILAARDAGLTVPQVADLLGWSQANVFRVSALAKEAAGS